MQGNVLLGHVQQLQPLVLDVEGWVVSLFDCKLSNPKWHKLKPPGWCSLSHFYCPQQCWEHGSPPAAWGRKCSEQPLCKSIEIIHLMLFFKLSNDFADKDMSSLLSNKINMCSMFFCSACAVHSVHTCQAGGTQLMCCQPKFQNLSFCSGTTYHVSKKGGSFFYHMHNVKKQIQIFLANTHQPKTNYPGLCPPWLQICWHVMRIVPWGKTYLSPTRIPGKTSSEILRTLPALPISLKLSPRGFTLLFSPPLSLYSSATQVAVLFTTSDFWRQ